ncbi:hypothetical protein DFH11DRAFT_1214153 [Phellopilus nigrolimitatus]|nr:hypothetical protein DFH11DRAFT_1214153 [Phellopilus nigrolimitatus]
MKFPSPKPPDLHPKLHEASDEEEHSSVLESFYQFGLEDADEMRRRRKGKGKDKTDAELALDLFAEDAAAILTCISDNAIARSMQKAIETDNPLLEELTRIERLEQEDHNLAVALSRGANVPTSSSHSAATSTPSSTSSSPTSARTSAEFSRTTSTSLARPRAPLSGSSRFQVSTSSSKLMWDNKNERKKEECVICMEIISGRAIKVPCGHSYDRDCLVSLFTSTTTDESLFPPRCCKQAIPLYSVQAYMKADTLELYKEKSLEFSTQIRLYCSNKICSRFLGPRSEAATNVICPACRESTCAMCSDGGHPKEVACTDDDAAKVVLDLGREHGWQRCPDCRQLVELDIGCYHMTCRCRTQFCYLCAEIWKKCACTQWDEERLTAAAERRVQQMPVQEGQNWAPNIVDRINREVANLRVNHDCEHQYFAYRPGGGRCETCRFNLPSFLLVSIIDSCIEQLHP